MRSKHHYVWHYPDLILKFGPLIRVWAMRFESKHTYFKRAIRLLHNFINVTKSLSEKHELLQSLVRLGADIRSEVQTHNSFLFEEHLYAEDLQAAVLIANLPKNLEECSSVTVKGTVYEKGNAVVVNQSDYQFEVILGQTCTFLHEDNTNVHVLVEIVENYFRPQIRAYEMGKILRYECRALDQLVAYEPLHIYNLVTKLYIKPMYGLVATPQRLRADKTVRFDLAYYKKTIKIMPRFIQ